VRLDYWDINSVPTNLVDSTTPGFLEVIATSRVARPAVRVTDERGDLVSLYHAVIYPTNQSRWQMPPPHIQGQPSADGVVKLGPILPGDYLVAALVPADFLALVNDVARVRELAAVAARVTFSEGDDRTLEMKVIPLPGASRR